MSLAFLDNQRFLIGLAVLRSREKHAVDEGTGDLSQGPLAYLKFDDTIQGKHPALSLES